MHFFKTKEDLLKFGVLRGYYIFTYDIPYELLIENSGIGYYENADDFFFASSFDELEDYLSIVYSKKVKTLFR